MKNKVITRVGIGLALAGLLLVACKKSPPSSGPTPHSVDAVMEALVVHTGLLSQAVQRKDFQYVHDYAWYLKKLVETLYLALEPGQQEQVKSQCGEIVEVSNQLDAASGRKLEEAVLAGIQRLQEIVKEMDAKLKGTKTT